MCKGYGLDIRKGEEVKKEEWKRMVKKGIQEKIEREILQKESEMRKMRHQRGDKYERKKYIKEMGVNEVVEVMRTRIELWEIIIEKIESVYAKKRRQ